ncbi:MAG TPA: hypothetical protein VLA77_00460 [Candidatus Saccharimonadales bacterium]|nr:hypothetical protein [Candidatus Saccharimonadales bacterium]
MVDLLSIHIFTAALLISVIIYRFARQMFFAKRTQKARVLTFVLTGLQIITGIGLMFGGASLGRVCVPGLALVFVVIASDFALKRLQGART